MEKKLRQGFLSSLKTEVVRGLSPSRSRPTSPMSRRSRSSHYTCPDALAPRSGSLTLAPLMEGPDPGGDLSRSSSSSASSLGQWVKGQFSRAPSISSSASNKKCCDPRLMLGVLGAPLAPIPVSSSDPLPLLSIKDTAIVSLSLSLSL